MNNLEISGMAGYNLLYQNRCDTLSLPEQCSECKSYYVDFAKNGNTQFRLFCIGGCDNGTPPPGLCKCMNTGCSTGNSACYHDKHDPRQCLNNMVKGTYLLKDRWAH
jgi:hypothetical protein